MANKKILFIYAPGMGAQWPNYGLVMLASRMKELGHTPQVIDYNFTPDAPDLKTCLQEFAPDIVGFSLYTASMENTRRLVQVVRVNAPQTPIIGGGPHASVYSEEIEKEQVLDWLFIGNAEESLAHHLSSIKRESQTVVVKDPPPDIKNVPNADFNLAWSGYSRMVYRPIQLSRGCPYACSFCSVKCITSRKIKYRNMSSCLDELEQDVKRHPHLSFVRIVDDCSTFDLPLFKQFLRSYIDRGIGKMIHIDNLRADRVDHEMLELLKQIGVDHLCIGVESGNPDVFRLVNKGETLDEIISAEGKSSFPGLDLSVSEASCETDDYSSRERTRMQLSAVLMTGCYLLNPLWLGKIFSIVNRYRLWKAFFAGLPLAIRIDTEMAYHRIKCQIATRQWKDLSLLKIPRVIGQEHN